MTFLRSPKAKLFASLFKAPEVPPEQQADRIRFMERDVCLTIKVIVLGVLSYYFLSNWFEGVSTIGELGTETVRGAFLTYVVANLIIGGFLLAMDYLPVAWVQWAVFVLNIVDGIFFALLVIISGGLESTIYWVFLVLVIRNAVSITRVRLQIAVNLFIILCYLFAGLLDIGMQELRREQEQIESAFDREGEELREVRQLRRAFTHAKMRLAEERDPKALFSLQAQRDELARQLKDRIGASYKAGSTNQTAVAVNPAAWRMADVAVADTTDLSHAGALVLINLVETPRIQQSLLNRILLLLLLACSCYGINVLADLQLQAQEEAREFAVRQEQLRSTGRLAAEIAHQLKNPLAIINNAAFSLQKTLAEAKPSALLQLEMIREEVTRSDRIITELMGYAQLAEGRVERVQVHDEIEQALARAFPPALQHEILIQVDCPKDLPPLLLQRAHLREALVNLLTNARDALAGKGRIEVAARRDDQDAVVISVTDSGPGIPEYQREQIFEPYFSTKEKGTGLGLAIVRHNVEIYGGKVRVESTLGKGTCFTLTFPAKSTMSTAA